MKVAPKELRAIEWDRLDLLNGPHDAVRLSAAYAQYLGFSDGAAMTTQSSHAEPRQPIHGESRFRFIAGPALLSRAREADAWPRTTRVLPWMIAGFLAMLWLVPFQSVSVPIRLPFDSKLDRFVLVGIALVWLAALVVGGKGAPRLRGSLSIYLALMLGVVAATSVVLNAEILANVDDLSLASKKIPLLFTYVLFFVIASSSIRPPEVMAFAGLTLILAAITSVGAIWEYRTQQNLFRDITAQLLPPGFGLQAFELQDNPGFGRLGVLGPTGHGLALTAILSFALPIAVVALINARSPRERRVSALATALILTAQVATVRRTAVVMPVAAFLVLFAYHPRRILRLAPLGLLIVVFIQTVTPAALSTLRYFLKPSVLNSDGSTAARTEDYAAVLPDIKTHLVFGRGYGSYDPHKYRILDNQYLGMLVETGVIGFVFYLALILSVVYAAHKIIRRGSPKQANVALGLSAGAIAFLTGSALFDTLAFIQVPYLFFFAAALAVVLTSDLPPKTTGQRPPLPLKQLSAHHHRLEPQK